MKTARKKKLMLLGGLRYLLPVIEAAHKEGYHVITCDYLPDNVAHKYSDEYYNVSIVDKEKVLALAKELGIDGILSFAVDPGVVTAAYVAEKMELPSAGPYESVRILQNKDLFRSFLERNGFNVPKAKVYEDFREMEADSERFNYPLIVKPTDSAGSKGVTRVDYREQLKRAFDEALAFSMSGRIILEEFVEKAGCSSDSDCFSVDGVFKVITFSSQHFDENAPNPYVPSSFSWPSTYTREQQEYLSTELQRLIGLLDLGTSIYNVETRVGTDGTPYIMELSPRGGGNRLAEMVGLVTGIDLIRATVRSAVGEPVGDLTARGSGYYWSEVIVHADKEGSFRGLDIAEDFKRHIYQTDLWVKPGDPVSAFKGANNSIGTLILRFEEVEMMEEALRTVPRWCWVRVE